MILNMNGGSGGGVEIQGIIESYIVSAGQSVSAGDFVEYVNGEFLADKQISSDTYSGEYIYAVALSASSVFILFNQTKFYSLHGVVCTFNGSTITVGTITTIHTNNVNYDATYPFSVCKLSGTSVAILYEYHDGGGSNSVDRNYLYVVVCTINGTTITVGSKTQILYDQNSIWYAGMTALSSEKLFVTYLSDTSENLYGVVCTINGTTVSSGTKKAITSGTTIASGGSAIIYAMSETSAIVCYSANNLNLNARICTINGTTITVGTATVLSNVQNSGHAISLVKLSDSKVFIAHSYGDYYNLYAMVCTISGTTITVGTDTALSTDDGSGEYIGECLASSNVIYIFHSSDDSSYYLDTTVCTVNGTTITVEVNTTLVSTANSGKTISSVSSYGTIFVAHGKSSKLNLLVGKIDGIQKRTNGNIMGVATTGGSGGETVQVYVPS